MTISGNNPGEQVKDVRLSEDALSVDLVDGRTITVPLAWYPRLLHATTEQRSNWQISAYQRASPVVVDQRVGKKSTKLATSGWSNSTEATVRWSPE